MLGVRVGERRVVSIPALVLHRSRTAARAAGDLHRPRRRRDASTREILRWLFTTDPTLPERGSADRRAAGRLQDRDPPAGHGDGLLMSLRHGAYAAMLLFVLAGCLPLHRVYGLSVLRQPRRLALAVLPVAVVFAAWDVAATAAGHWHFDPSQTLAVRVAGLPLEEYAFFVVIPLAGILTYEAVGRRPRAGTAGARQRGRDLHPRRRGRGRRRRSAGGPRRAAHPAAGSPAAGGWPTRSCCSSSC